MGDTDVNEYAGPCACLLNCVRSWRERNRLRQHAEFLRAGEFYCTALLSQGCASAYFASRTEEKRGVVSLPVFYLVGFTQSKVMSPRGVVAKVADAICSLLQLLRSLMYRGTSYCCWILISSYCVIEPQHQRQQRLGGIRCSTPLLPSTILHRCAKPEKLC